MDAAPMVSIVCGTYNAVLFIDDLVTSLAMQTFKDFECIFVDDGSADHTVSHLRQLALRDSRLRVIEKSPEGSPARSRNVGIEAARGEFVAFCDHDDFWAPTKLERQLRAFELYPDASLVHTARLEWTSPGIPASFPVMNAHDAAIGPQSRREALYLGCKITQSSVMVRRKNLLAIGLLDPELRGVDDYHAFLKLSLRGPIVRVDEPLTYYRWHEDNLSHVQHLFINGLRQMGDKLDREGLPAILSRSVRAQADKSEAVLLLVNEPMRALRLLFKSFATFPMSQTAKVGVVGLFCLILPSSWRRLLVKRLRGPHAVGQL